MQNKNGLAWGYVLVLGATAGGAAGWWLGLAGLTAWMLTAAFVLVALSSCVLARGLGGIRSAYGDRSHGSAADLRRDFDRLLVECMEQFSTQYGLVQDEVGRMDSLLADAIETLTRSFNGMHQQGDILRNLAFSAAKDNAVAPSKVSDVATAADLLAQEVARAVTALQFQDIVSQLTAHVKNRIAALDEVVRGFSNLASRLRIEVEQGSTREGSNSLQQEIVRMKQSLADLALITSRNPVSQNAMPHGDVELF